MRIEHLLLLGFVLIAHAWQPRIIGDAAVLSVIGWTLNVLAIVLLILALVHGAGP